MHPPTATLRGTNISMIMDFPQPRTPYIPFGVTGDFENKVFFFFSTEIRNASNWLRALPAPSPLVLPSSHFFCMYQQVTPLFGFT